MIRYDIDRDTLETKITEISKNWLRTARKKTLELRKRKIFTEDGNYWSNIKDAYRILQYDKCAYCEIKLEGGPEGSIEHDVEHFRPKSSVREWPTEKMRAEKKSRTSYSFSTGGNSKNGYYLLAFHIFNYATACKVCNTIFKSNFFPIAGSRKIHLDDPAKLSSEQPYLIYPLGDLDDDPESLITFKGIIPVPKLKSGPKYKRARLTIDFFNLDTREKLLEGRASKIQSMWIAFEALKNSTNAATLRRIETALNNARSAYSPHSSCSKAFYQLCESDFKEATKFYDAANDYLMSKTDTFDRLKML